MRLGNTEAPSYRSRRGFFIIQHPCGAYILGGECPLCTRWEGVRAMDMESGMEDADMDRQRIIIRHQGKARSKSKEER